MPRLHRLILALALSALLPSCISEDDLRRDWGGYVDTVNECTDDAACAVISPGCPLGCYDTVNVDSVEDAMAEADRLVGSYEGTGRSCEYDCEDPPVPVCLAGLCQFE